MSSYRTLDPPKVVATAEGLHRRVAERFPDSSLSRIAAEVLEVSHEAAGLAQWLQRPNWWLRGAIGLVILLVVAIVTGAVLSLDVRLSTRDASDLFQGVEAAINDVIFLGIAIAFLVNWETRLRRRRALAAIHVLRSLAHIIDMHQLTKDPERLLFLGPDTASSPPRTMTAFALTRYLDYCTELLSLISKIAAIYVARFGDGVTLAAVNEVEHLTTGLSRKIWQKILLVDRVVEEAREAERGAAPRSSSG